MKFEIDLPSECGECVFCQEFVFCGLLCGEPIYTGSSKDWDYDHRAKFCPFDNKEKRNELYNGVRILD